MSNVRLYKRQIWAIDWSQSICDWPWSERCCCVLCKTRACHVHPAHDKVNVTRAAQCSHRSPVTWGTCRITHRETRRIAFHDLLHHFLLPLYSYLMANKSFATSAVACVWLKVNRRIPNWHPGVRIIRRSQAIVYEPSINKHIYHIGNSWSYFWFKYKPHHFLIQNFHIHHFVFSQHLVKSRFYRSLEVKTADRKDVIPCGFFLKPRYNSYSGHCVACCCAVLFQRWNKT